MVQFLDPETADILQFLDPEIVKIDKQISGSRNSRNGAISGSRNRRKGRQILYHSILNRHHLYMSLSPYMCVRLSGCTKIVCFSVPPLRVSPSLPLWAFPSPMCIFSLGPNFSWACHKLNHCTGELGWPPIATGLWFFLNNRNIKIIFIKLKLLLALLVSDSMGTDAIPSFMGLYVWRNSLREDHPTYGRNNEDQSLRIMRNGKWAFCTG